MKVRRSLLRDTVTVAAYLTDGPYGPTFSAPVPVRCRVEPAVAIAGTDDEVTAGTVLWIHPADAAPFTLEARVTVAGRALRVVDRRDHVARHVSAYAVQVTLR